MTIDEAVDIIYDKGYMEGVHAAFRLLCNWYSVERDVPIPTVERAFPGPRATVGQFKEAKQLLAGAQVSTSGPYVKVNCGHCSGKFWRSAVTNWP